MWLFFARHAPVVRFPESCKPNEYVYNHLDLRPCSEEHIYEIVFKSNKTPVQPSDDEQDAREHIDSSHRKKEKDKMCSAHGKYYSFCEIMQEFLTIFPLLFLFTYSMAHDLR